MAFESAPPPTAASASSKARSAASNGSVRLRPETVSHSRRVAKSTGALSAVVLAGLVRELGVRAAKQGPAESRSAVVTSSLLMVLLVSRVAWNRPFSARGRVGLEVPAQHLSQGEYRQDREGSAQTEARRDHGRCHRHDDPASDDHQPDVKGIERTRATVIPPVAARMRADHEAVHNEERPGCEDRGPSSIWATRSPERASSSKTAVASPDRDRGLRRR